MALHHKPTKEELQANIDKAAEELEEMDKEEEKDLEEDVEEVETDEEDTEDEDTEDSEDSDEDDSDDEESDEEDTEEDEDDQQEEEEPEEKKPEKKKLTEEEKDKKLKASTQESQILYARNKQIQDAIENAANIEPPTDEEMKKEFSNWDEMSDFEKKMARDNEHNKRKVDSITAATTKFKELDAWQKEVDEYIDDPATIANEPRLDGKKDEFRIFATKPTRRGVAFEDLVKAFLFDVETDRKSRPKKKGKMFESGTGGHKREKPKKTKLSASEAGRLRKTNYKKYVSLLKSGKIDPADLS